MESEASRVPLLATRCIGLLDSVVFPVFPTAGQESWHNEEQPVAPGSVAQPRPLESEEQRAGARPRRRRDLGSRLQAQRRAQRVAWAEVDENEEEAIIPGERGPAWRAKGLFEGTRGPP